MGAAWDRDELRTFVKDGSRFQLGGLKADFGYGFQMRMGGMLMRWDFAWPTDMKSRGRRKVHFSIGAQF